MVVNVVPRCQGRKAGKIKQYTKKQLRLKRVLDERFRPKHRPRRKAPLEESAGRSESPTTMVNRIISSSA